MVLKFRVPKLLVNCCCLPAMQVIVENAACAPWADKECCGNVADFDWFIEGFYFCEIVLDCCYHIFFATSIVSFMAFDGCRKGTESLGCGSSSTVFTGLWVLRVWFFSFDKLQRSDLRNQNYCLFCSWQYTSPGDLGASFHQNLNNRAGDDCPVSGNYWEVTNLMIEYSVRTESHLR